MKSQYSHHPSTTPVQMTMPPNNNNKINNNNPKINEHELKYDEVSVSTFASSVSKSTTSIEENASQTSIVVENLPPPIKPPINLSTDIVVPSKVPDPKKTNEKPINNNNNNDDKKKDSNST